MSVPFIQFRLPAGEAETVSINRPPDIEKAADALRGSGYRFEAEILRTGEVSMTCSPLSDTEQEAHGDLAHVICTNNSAVLVAVDKLIRDATDELSRTRTLRETSR